MELKIARERLAQARERLAKLKAERAAGGATAPSQLDVPAVKTGKQSPSAKPEPRLPADPIRADAVQPAR